MDFLHAVTTHTFLWNAVLAGLLSSVAAGVVGTYVVARRITYIAGGIAHCVLGGMGVARYLAVVKGWEGIEPLYGAVAAALLAAVIIGWVTLQAREREDTVIGAIWAVGMAVGIVSITQTPGYNEDLMSYLFGNILMVSSRDLYFIAGLDIIVVLLSILFYRQFLAVAFDEEFARIRGVKVEFVYILLLCLTALTVVIMVDVVGIVMVIALLTLPAAVAGLFARTLWRIMILAVLLCIGFTWTGLALSFEVDIPSGATIILVAGATYLIVTLSNRIARPFR